MSRKSRKKIEPLPPGEYTMKIDRVRKVRNKDAYRMHLTLEDGSKTSVVLKP